ncbi:macro domain-containing protein [Ferrimonas aestuarii]|uniref:Macro domain-containing protein n=1 Tax=Ferrimonas aestuarii TaxID=2569539 RepID=A0A4U1BL06_9GAMM|nr:macro domain-containing protein [Ferrimonas aestuarii]TKB53078.1 hypothetical protein FCL42_15510 [Ferrimonas aestuarii]
MIKFKQGDFFDYDADVRVNTVNCVGVMGKGVAAAFKTKFPEMFKEYARLCKLGEIRPGKPHLWKEGDMFSKALEIVNFPTKDHWRKPSEYEYIESGLQWMHDYLVDKERSTITLPALGCGHGGLDWDRVKNLISKYLGELEHDILVFEPISSVNAESTFASFESRKKALSELEISTIENVDSRYPERIKSYTDRPLFVLGDIPERYDVTIISSSSPDEEESNEIKCVSKFCIENRLSVVLGPSKYEKIAARNIANLSSCKVAISLPSGISTISKKANEKVESNYVSIFSMGNPDSSYDRKEYMPSVINRLLMADIVFITTEKVSWIKKYKKYFPIGKTFISSSNTDVEGYHAISQLLAAKTIDFANKDCLENILVESES